MSTHKQPLLSEALRLPPIERAELIEKLLSSFELPSGIKINALWAREAENRIDAFEHGKIKAISARKVFKKINQTTQ